MKLCLILLQNLGAEMTVEESINLQVFHWSTPQGKIPLSDDDFWCRLLPATYNIKIKYKNMSKIYITVYII